MTPILIPAVLPDGRRFAGHQVRITLVTGDRRPGFTGETHVMGTATHEMPRDGDLTVDLVPNAGLMAGSLYAVEIVDASMPGDPQSWKVRIQVPDEPGPEAGGAWMIGDPVLIPPPGAPGVSWEPGPPGADAPSTADEWTAAPSADLAVTDVQAGLDELGRRTGAAAPLHRLRDLVEFGSDFTIPPVSVSATEWDLGDGWTATASHDTAGSPANTALSPRGLMDVSLTGSDVAHQMTVMSRARTGYEAPSQTEFMVAIPTTGGSRFTVQIGLFVPALGGFVACFRYDGGATSQVQTVTQGSSATTETHTRTVWSPAPPLSVWHRFGIVADPGNSVQFLLDGDLLATHTTNVNAMSLFAVHPAVVFARHPDATGFATRTVNIDYIAAVVEVNR